MRKLSIALAATTALVAGPALAADLGRPAPRMDARAPAAVVEQGFNWSGFYIGAQGGYGWGRTNFNFLDDDSTGDFDISGGLLGGTIGVNWQMGSMVLGLEGDGAASWIKGSLDCGGGISCETRNNWLGTARARLGWATGNIMPYITGGAAFGEVEANFLDGAGNVLGGQKETRLGWTAGAGVEVALNQNWSVKAEYLYVDLGSFDCSITNCGDGAGSVSFDSHVIRGGINYRFNWGGGAPVMARY